MPGLIVASRLAPKLGPQFYKSFSLRRPLTSHWRKATCEEVDCPDFVLGFQAAVDTSTPLGQAQYDYLHRDRTRSFTERAPGIPSFWERLPPETYSIAR